MLTKNEKSHNQCNVANAKFRQQLQGDAVMACDILSQIFKHFWIILEPAAGYVTFCARLLSTILEQKMCLQLSLTFSTRLNISESVEPEKVPSLQHRLQRMIGIAEKHHNADCNCDT